MALWLYGVPAGAAVSIFTKPKGGASGPAFIACHWDDVAVRKGAPHYPFCSARCEAAFEKDRAERSQARCHETPSTAPRDPCYPVEVLGRLPLEADWETTAGLALPDLNQHQHCDELDWRAEQVLQRTLGVFEADRRKPTGAYAASLTHAGLK